MLDVLSLFLSARDQLRVRTRVDNCFRTAEAHRIVLLRIYLRQTFYSAKESWYFSTQCADKIDQFSSSLGKVTELQIEAVKRETKASDSKCASHVQRTSQKTIAGQLLFETREDLVNF